MRLSLILLLGLMFVACQPPEVEEQNTSKRISIAQLRELVGEGYEVINSQLYIEGVVLADDRTGNFDGALIVGDNKGGVELLTGLYDNARLYPEGNRLVVHLQGLAIDKQGGVVRIGLPANEGVTPALQPISHAPLLMRYISSFAPIDSLPVTRLEEGVHVGCRVVVEDVWCVDTMAVWSGRHPFCNRAGDTLIVHTLPEAHFASDSIPADTLYLEGILYGDAIRLINYKKRACPLADKPQ